MGKEWYFAGRSSKRGVGGGAEAETQAPSGCMCAVFLVQNSNLASYVCYIYMLHFDF